DRPRVFQRLPGANRTGIAGAGLVAQWLNLREGVLHVSSRRFSDHAHVELGRGTLRPASAMGDKPPDHPLLKRVPAAETLAKNEEARQSLRAMNAPSQITNPYVVHPEVPRDRVEALRKAFTSTFNDVEFLADARKSRIEFTPSSGE